MTEWVPRTGAQSLAGAAARWPDAQALMVEGRVLTYAEFWQEVRVTAANLRRLGLRRGDHFAICMGNSVEWAVLFFAAATLGAVTVPVNTRFKAEELAYCLRQADIRMLAVADRFLKIDFIAMLREIAPAVDRALPDPALPELAAVIVFGGDVPAGALGAAELSRPADRLPDQYSEGVTPDDVLLIQYTSGTTSYPKGVMLTCNNMLRDAFEVARRLDIRPGDRFFSARPLFHVAGTALSLLAAVEAGACYITVENFDVDRVLDILERERCTHTNGNDTMFLMMMNHSSFPARRFHLRSGLAAASETILHQIHDRMGIKGIAAGYGLSEASPNCALAAHDDELGPRLAGFAKPLPGVELRIRQRDGEGDAAPREIGEILVRGWNVMKGYYNMPEQTAATIDADGWLHTGDLGLLDEAGRLYFVGRLKDSFRVGGENVSPAEVEDVLHRHPAIKQAQVIGVPDPRLMEVGAAYIILNEGASAEPNEIIEWCRPRMANFKTPRYVRIVAGFDGIGMTASSKVQKNKLRDYAVKDLGLEEVARATAR